MGKRIFPAERSLVLARTAYVAFVAAGGTDTMSWEEAAFEFDHTMGDESRERWMAVARELFDAILAIG